MPKYKPTQDEMGESDLTEADPIPDIKKFEPTEVELAKVEEAIEDLHEQYLDWVKPSVIALATSRALDGLYSKYTHVEGIKQSDEEWRSGRNGTFDDFRTYVLAHGSQFVDSEELLEQLVEVEASARDHIDDFVREDLRLDTIHMGVKHFLYNVATGSNYFGVNSGSNEAKQLVDWKIARVREFAHPESSTQPLDETVDMQLELQIQKLNELKEFIDRLEE